MTFAFLFVALVGFWIGYIARVSRRPQPQLPTQGTPLLLMQFVDVGAGDAAIASSPGGFLMLIDCGPDASGARSILDQLERIRKRAPTVILLTNSRARSIGGAAYLIDHCPFRGVVVLPMPVAEFTRAGGNPARELIFAAQRHRLRLIAWQQLESSSFEPALLSDYQVAATPIAVMTPRNTAQALAVRIDIRGSSENGSLFYAAGLTDEDEDDLLSQRARLSCDILAATDGGQAGSLSSEFLAAAGPDIVCISTSSAAPPYTGVLERLKAADATLERTDLSGTVTLGLTGKLGDQAETFGTDAVLPIPAKK